MVLREESVVAASSASGSGPTGIAEASWRMADLPTQSPSADAPSDETRPGPARPPQPHRVQPGADPLGQPGRPGGGRRGRPVRRRDLDPRRGQRCLPLRRRTRRRTSSSPGPTRSSPASGEASAIKVRDSGEDEDLRRACADAGMELFGEAVPEMICRRPAPRRRRPSTTWRVRWVDDEAGVRDFIAVNAEAYGDLRDARRGPLRSLRRDGAAARGCRRPPSWWPDAPPSRSPRP